MDDWFENIGKPALLAAVGQACDQIKQDYKSSLDNTNIINAELNTELERLRSQAYEADRLRQDNENLKLELLRCRKSQTREQPSSPGKPSSSIQTPRPTSRSDRTPLAPRSSNTSLPLKKDSGKPSLQSLREEFLKLERSYIKLSEKYGELEHANETLNNKLRERSQAHTKWVQYAETLGAKCERQRAKIKALESKLGALAKEPPVPNANGPLEPIGSWLKGERAPPGSISSPTPRPPEVYVALDRALSVPGEPVLSTSSHGHVQHALSSADLRSSGPETESDGPSLPPVPPPLADITSNRIFIKREPSSDPPVVVSERSVRKRRHDEDQLQDMPALTRVKMEDVSDPLAIEAGHQFTAHESIDFDDDGRRIQTPRKHRVFQDNIRPVQLGLLNDNGHGSSEEADGAMQNVVRQASPLNVPRSTGGTGSSSLQALAAGLQAGGPIAAPRLSTSRNIRNALAHMAEDGEHLDGLSRPAQQHFTPTGRTGRLDSLLNGPSLTPETLHLPSGTKSRIQEQSAPSRVTLPPRRELPFEKGERARTVGGLQQTPAPNGLNPHRTPRSNQPKSKNVTISNEATEGVEYVALRNRPRSLLRLGDFKVNPKMNNGYEFAYTDVVRKKDERASMAGCIDEDCPQCGETIATLRLQAKALREKTGTISFQTLLESHLGDEAWKIASMPSNEKEKLWLDAKTQELANHCSRHRQNFARQPTPPGFWRTDFPDTQEEEQDRNRAETLEQRRIEERYREALRPDGRWLFRDE